MSGYERIKTNELSNSWKRERKENAVDVMMILVMQSMAVSEVVVVVIFVVVVVVVRYCRLGNEK